MDILTVIIRILHVGSAIALLGGTLYALAVLLPATRLVDEGLRGSLLQLAQRRFYRVAHPAIVLLILTGAYNFWINLDAYREVGPISHGLLGVKILLALAILGIIFAQTFRVLPGPPARWAALNLTMGTIIIIIAAIVRHLRLDAISIVTGG